MDDINDKKCERPDGIGSRGSPASGGAVRAGEGKERSRTSPVECGDALAVL